MRALALSGALALAACGGAQPDQPATNAADVVSISLPDEPVAPWTGASAAIIERNCVACHSPEMIATQPPLPPDKWQATIDKMRTVYKAQIDPKEDAALVAALVAVQAKR